MKHKLILIVTILCYSCAVWAQKNTPINGTILDEQGESIPGASILIEGSKSGTISDADGSFTISASPSDILTVSFIGFKTNKVKVGKKKNLKITLLEDNKSLDEVVVVAVGYGDVRRRDLTGSIGKANLDDLTKTPITNIAESLGGRIAGVTVSSTDGGLGDNFNIVIRGAGSLTQSTAPLYVIDGFPQGASAMSSINPNDIASMDVLKDASATAIYGSRGANGVIIINTKKGQEGKPTVTYNGSISVGTVGKTPSLMKGYEFAKLQQEIMSEEDFDKYYLQDGLTLNDYKTLKSYNWQDEVYRTALSHNHHLLLSGKQGNLNYSASLSFNDNQGVIINSNLKKYQGRFNINQRLSDKLNIDANATYSSNIQNGPSPATGTTSMSTAWMYSVWAYRPVSPSGSDLMSELYDSDVNMAEDYRFNPVLSAQNEYRKRTTNNLRANLSVNYEIIKDLKFKISAGYVSRDFKNEQFNGSKTRTGNSFPGNTQSKGINARLQLDERRSYLNENTLTYQFRRKKHSFNVLGGLTFQKNTRYAHSITTEHITNESFGMAGLDKSSSTPVVTSSKSENSMMSYFGRFNYNYASKYYLTLSARADGSSKFLKSNRWGYFTSGSLAWTFSRENFIKNNAQWLSNGKIRLSYGSTGNNRIGDYAALPHLITSDNVYKYPWNNSFTPGYVLSSMGNKNLKWETTDQFDVGLDLGFIDNRLNITLDYYIKTTKDLLLSADIPSSSGFSAATLNIGKLRNKGLEISIESRNIENKNFSWTSSFNIAFNKNKILSLNSGQEQMTSYIRWDNHYRNMPAYVSKVGESAGKMYGFIYEGTYKLNDFDVVTDPNGDKAYKLKEGIPYYSENCQPGDPKYKKLSDDGGLQINDNDRTIIGNGQPKHTGGFTNNLTWKAFDLNIFFQWSYGNDILNANRLVFENPSSRRNSNMFTNYVNRWTEENPNSNMVRADAIGAKEYSSNYIEDGSFLKLKSITLGYTLPKSFTSKIKISSARIYFAAENIATISGYSGPDPEVSTRHSVLTPGFDWSAYPRSFTASFGLNLTF